MNNEPQVLDVACVAELQLQAMDDGSMRQNLQFNLELFKDLGIDANELIKIIDMNTVVNFSDEIFGAISKLQLQNKEKEEME